MRDPTAGTSDERAEKGAEVGTAGTDRPRPAAPPGVRRLRFDVDARPLLVLFELTRACALACRHCRAEAALHPDPNELTTAEVTAVLDDLASAGAPRPLLVFTGGDPLQRPDLLQLVRHARDAGLSVALSPAGTPRATPDALAALRAAGAGAVSFSIDGSTSETHDDFRRVDGSFAWTVAGCKAAVAAGLRLQVNTTVTTENVFDLPAIGRLVAELGAGLWSVFFLVPVGRGATLRALGPAETEDVLAFLADAAEALPLKTTEAPAFRRVLIQRQRAASPGDAPPPATGPLYRELRRRLDELGLPPRASRHDGPQRRPLAVGDGRGVVFVSHVGDVQPSGFLPLVAGNVRERPLSSIYAASPLLRSLRDPAMLKGRCGRCELREVCGGSRAQAFARTGDPLGEDPSCGYDPPERGAPGVRAGGDRARATA